MCTEQERQNPSIEPSTHLVRMDIHLVLVILEIVFYGHVQGQETPSPKPAEGKSILELEILGFRIWMIIAFVCVGFLIIVVVLCCIFDCRVPRTRQEIEQDHERRDLISKYKNKIKTMQYKKSKYSQARQRAAFMVGSWGFEGGGGEPDPGPSEGGGPAPLAQHPSAMLTADGGTNPANRPLGVIENKPTNTPTAKTLASLHQSSEESDSQPNTGL